MRVLKQLDPNSEVSIIEGDLHDLLILSQNIREDFFEPYEINRDADQNFKDWAAYELPRYSSLFRILDTRLSDIHDRAAALEKYLDAQEK